MSVPAAIYIKPSSPHLLISLARCCRDWTNYVSRASGREAPSGNSFQIWHKYPLWFKTEGEIMTVFHICRHTELVTPILSVHVDTVVFD